METLFLAWCFYDKCIYFGSFGYTEKGVSVARMKNPKPLSNRNTPPKLTFHTFRSTFDHSKVLFWLPSDFWRIFSNNVKQQMPISQNMFDHKATKMVPIVLDLWVNNKSKWKLWHFLKNWFWLPSDFWRIPCQIAKLKCQFRKIYLITKLQQWYQ